jgi:hypothetical protein
MENVMSHLFLTRAGLVCMFTGLLGAAGALVLLAWPPAIDPGPVSYPFTTTGFLIAQSWFFVHHVGLVAGVVALAVSGAVGAGRVARAGAWIAVVGTVLLTGCELMAMRYAEWPIESANAGLMGSSYGIACTVIGLGFVLAGGGVLRADTWSGWCRWTPMAIGVTQFVVLTPGMFGGFEAARLAIGFWMLMFAALGWSLYAESRRQVGGVVPLSLPVGTLELH